MGRLKDTRGRWLNGDAGKVSFLVSEVFGGLDGGRNEGVERMDHEVCPLSREEIKTSV